MIRLVCICMTVFLMGCGGSTKQTPKEDIINDSQKEELEEETKEEIIDEVPSIPIGAVSANFIANEIPFYAVVDRIDHNKKLTLIGFENKSIPKIKIPESYGATLSSLRFDEFDRDLLLVTAKIKDTNFNKYYLYIYRDTAWHSVTNGFAIHKSHVTDTLTPIKVDPSNPNNMFRYYSVFDLDKSSELGYTWRLLSESIPIENK